MSKKAEATLPAGMSATRSPAGWPAALIGLALFFAIALWLKGLVHPELHHPYLKADTEAGMSVTLLNYGTPDPRRCEKQVSEMALAMQTACPVCKITTQSCKVALSDHEYDWLGEGALPTPAARSSEGVILYDAANSALALATCRMSEAQAQGAPAGAGFRCHAAGAERPYPADQKAGIDHAKQNLNLVLTVAAGLCAAVAALLLSAAVPAAHAKLKRGKGMTLTLAAMDALVMLTAFAILSFPDLKEPLALRQFDLQNLLAHALLVGVTVTIFWVVLEHYTRPRPWREELREIIRTLMLQLLVAGAAVFYLGLESGRMATLLTWASLFIALPLGRIAAKQLAKAGGLWLEASPAAALSTSPPMQSDTLTPALMRLGRKYLFPQAGSLIAAVLMGGLLLFATLERPTLPMPRPFLSADINLALAIFSGLCAAIVSWFVVWLILQSSHLHGHLSHDFTDAGPQKVHSEPTPRIGGLAVACGLVFSAVVLVVAQDKLGSKFMLNTTGYILILVSALPAFLGGISEDLTKRVGPLDRLMLTMASGAFAAWLMGAVLTRLDIPWLDPILVAFPLLATLLTAFAVAGVANAINIIDGFNGLAAGYAFIVLCALGAVAILAQDNLILQISLALAGSLAGFLVWNWPRGKIFLGDGGAYLMGFLLAEIAVLLVMRNPEVSPWFPLLLMIYPVTETLYSVYRRKRLHKTKTGAPDRRHLHHLIHDAIARSRGAAEGSTNARVGKYLWVANLLIAASALMAWRSTGALMILAAACVTTYLLTYHRLRATVDK